jgi:NCAIR mutase (PurE)-related protein
MQILAIERSVKGADDKRFTAELAAAEAQRVWDLHQAGIVREIYFRADQTSAVVILECAGASDAAAALETLPLVHAGLIEFEVIPLRAYPGFARLFADA